MVRGIRQFIVATAAGAGLGAGAALIRRRAMRAFDHPDGPGAYAEPPAPAAAAGTAANAARPASPADPAPAPIASPAVEPTSDQADPIRSEIEALTASVADLEEARNRLRRRAAQLRAEMEGQDRDR